MSNLRQKIQEGQKRSAEGQILLRERLRSLSESGIDTDQLRKVLNKPMEQIILSDRSLSVGLTRHDNDFLKKGWDEFLNAQKEFNSKVNNIMAAQERDLKDYLLDDELCNFGDRYLKTLLRRVKKKHSAAIFFSIFKDLLYAPYDDESIPFASDKEFFKHVLRHVNPNDYLRSIPIKSNSPLWKKPIIEIYNLVRHKMKSNTASYELVSMLFCYSYPNSFLGDLSNEEIIRKYSEKVRRIIEKSTPEN